MMRFYNASPVWRSVLELSRSMVRAWLLTENAWPLKVDVLTEAREAINENIIALEDQKRTVEPGMLFTPLKVYILKL